MSETISRLIAIGVGGAVGAMARYGVGILCERTWGDRYAIGTLLVNSIGCFLLGFLMHEVWLATGGEDRPTQAVPIWHSGLAVGLLGGLTTFSTFGYQTVRHLEAGEFGIAMLNIGANVVIGLTAAGLGLAAARLVAS